MNAKGSFVDSHTIKAVMANGKEVRYGNFCLLIKVPGPYLFIYQTSNTGDCTIS